MLLTILSVAHHKGSIPASIGSLVNLTYLRLSYNAFVQELPTELGNLHHLELAQLNGNRIEGTIPIMGVKSLKEHWSFVADCGIPTALDEPVTCEGCTMCCKTSSLLWHWHDGMTGPVREEAPG